MLCGLFIYDEDVVNHGDGRYLSFFIFHCHFVFCYRCEWFVTAGVGHW